MEHRKNNYGVLTPWRGVDIIDAGVQPGDKIDVHRGGYNHVGISDGRGGIFHYSGEPKRKSGAHIRHDRLEEVAGDDKVRINNTEDKQMKPLPKREILRRAKNAVGTGHRKYNLSSNNCEHKATEIRYGEPVSEQVSTVEKVVFGIGIGALVVGTVCALFGKRTEEEDDNDDE